MITINTQTGTTAFLMRCIELYEEMLGKIAVCKTEFNDEEEMIQNCFDTVSNYKEQLKSNVRKHVFENADEEIFFFKKLKPLFTAELELYTYQYHMVLFKTKEIENKSDELIAYYKRQLLRRQKFMKEHPDFCMYMQEEETKYDKAWFTRKGQSKDASLFDGLAGRLMAIEKFEDYIKGLLIKQR